MPDDEDELKYSDDEEDALFLADSSNVLIITDDARLILLEMVMTRIMITPMILIMKNNHSIWAIFYLVKGGLRSP